MISFTNKDIEALALLNPVSANNNMIDVDTLIAKAHRQRSEHLRIMISAVSEKLGTAIRTRRENSKAASILRGMSNRELRDIGITRAEIDQVIYGEQVSNGGLLKKVSGVVASLASRYAQWRDHRNGFAQLMAMDARQLSDIGLTRGDVAAAVSGKVPLANDNTAKRNDGRQVS
ncbi:DUF1127 domain-containing protein [Sneathiella sp.]|jgi:uncharacterized protein YjiS (DUF1127 family)|uniref:DUF1127 domain-containing protein n=1 Tax=Sneathiella sp. TaxID=1964365 RepID=UPI0039E23EFD